MAAMCVKSKRLDVAEICIGNMRFARGARSIRQSKKQPELQSQLAMVAIQLGMSDEAKALYEDGKRYDLLNKMNQANGQPEQAIEVAQKMDRINLKNTYYNAAKFYQASNDFTRAIELYQKSGTHFKEVPRMLLESQRLRQLQQYVNQKKQKQLYLWLGQYKQSIGQITEAIKYYNSANSSSNLVRLHLSQDQLQQSIKICNAQSQPQACFLLARYLQKQGKISQAIHFYAKAQYYSQAIKIAIDRQLDGQIMSLSMMSPKQVVFRSAAYFERKGLIQKAVVLYRKAGATKKSVDMAIKYNLKQYIRPQQIDQNQQAQQQGGQQDLATLNNRVNGFIDAGKYDRAVPFLINAKQYERALDICIQYNVPITQQLVQKMIPDTPTNSAEQNNKRNQLIKTVAQKCRKQGAFELASQLFIRLGDKIKAMKSLIQLGDQQKIIKFATNARMAQIFILAGNYLQTADWNKNTNLMKYIISFYTKAKAYDSLAGFFQACSSVEIDQYRNYQKALSALKQAMKNATLSSGQQRESRIASIQQKINLTDRFLKAQALCQTNPQGMIDECQALLANSEIQQAVRVGDIFSLLIEYYYEIKNYNGCYDLLKKMQERKIIATPYIDQQIIQNVYAALGIRNTKHQKKKQVQQEIVEQDIRY